MNILIGGVHAGITNLSNIISVIFNVLLLAYLIKIWFVSQIPLLAFYYNNLYFENDVKNRTKERL